MYKLGHSQLILCLALFRLWLIPYNKVENVMKIKNGADVG